MGTFHPRKSVEGWRVRIGPLRFPNFGLGIVYLRFLMYNFFDFDQTQTIILYPGRFSLLARILSRNSFTLNLWNQFPLFYSQQQSYSQKCHFPL